MNRRQLLRGALFGLPLIAAPGALVDLLAPKRTIFLPPKQGWPTGNGYARQYFVGQDGPTWTSGDIHERFRYVAIYNAERSCLLHVMAEPVHPEKEFCVVSWTRDGTFDITLHPHERRS